MQQNRSLGDSRAKKTVKKQPMPMMHQKDFLPSSLGHRHLQDLSLEAHLPLPRQGKSQTLRGRLKTGEPSPKMHSQHLSHLFLQKKLQSILLLIQALPKQWRRTLLPLDLEQGINQRHSSLEHKAVDQNQKWIEKGTSLRLARPICLENLPPVRAWVGRGLFSELPPLQTRRLLHLLKVCPSPAALSLIK